MDKPSDKINRPFFFPGDEAQVAQDYRDEYKLPPVSPYDDDPEPAQSRAVEHMQDKRAEKLREAQSGELAEVWRPAHEALPETPYERAEHEQCAASVRSMRGGLPDAPDEAPRAVEQTPFKLG